jgi:hypothetical protein
MATHDHTARRVHRLHLTDGVARKLAASGKTKIFYDDTLRGFGLRIDPRQHGCSPTASTASSTG